MKSNDSKNIEEFIKKLSDGKKFRELINSRINLKGIYPYKYILNSLEKNYPKTKPSFVLINSIYVYEKRIRNQLYKYISLIEEHYKAILVNNFPKIEERVYKENFTFDNQKTKSQATKVNFGLQYTENFENRQYQDSELKAIENYTTNEIFSNRSKYNLPDSANIVNSVLINLPKSITIDGKTILSFRFSIWIDKYYDYNKNIINEEKIVNCTIYPKDLPNVDFIPLQYSKLDDDLIYPFLKKYDPHSVSRLLHGDQQSNIENGDQQSNVEIYNDIINDISNNIDSIYFKYPTNFADRILNIFSVSKNNIYILKFKDCNIKSGNYYTFVLIYTLKPKKDFIKNNSVLTLNIGNGNFDSAANDKIIKTYGSYKSYISNGETYLPVISNITIRYFGIKDDIVIYKCNSTLRFSDINGKITNDKIDYELHIVGFTSFSNSPNVVLPYVNAINIVGELTRNEGEIYYLKTIITMSDGQGVPNNVEYQWFLKDGSKDIVLENKNGKEIWLDATRELYGKQIYVKATCNNKSITSPPKELNVILCKIQSLNIDGNGVVMEGQHFTFNSNYSMNFGDKPSSGVTYQWYLKEDDKETPIQDETNSNIDIISTLSMSSKSIILKATFRDMTITSNAISLIVKPKLVEPQPPSPGQPSIEQSISSVSITGNNKYTIGDSINLLCNIITNDGRKPSSSVSYKWLKLDKDGETVINNQTSDVLSVKADNTYKNASIVVEVTFKDKPVKSKPFTLTLKDKQQPSNTVNGIDGNSGLVEDSNSNLWIYIAIGCSTLLLIIIIVSIVVSKKKKQQKKQVKQNVRVQQVARTTNQQVKTITTSRTIPTKSSSSSTPTFRNSPPSSKKGRK